MSFHGPIHNALTGGAAVVVDLAAAPYAVRAGSTSAAAANTAAINSAINTYSGARALLRLPRGTVYLDRANVTDNWCIKFGPGVTDVSLTGHGMFSTTLAEYTAGDLGASDLILFDQCQRCSVSSLGVYQDTITNPDPIQSNHLISVYNTAAGTTQDILVSDVYFGKSIGDQFRVFGDTTQVVNVTLQNFLMHGAGTVTSTPGNGRVGSRSGIALQRGFNGVHIRNGYIDGAQNSNFDMEPSGTTVCEYLDVENVVLGTQSGTSDANMSVGGVSGGTRARYLRFRNITVLKGAVNLISTDDCEFDGLTIRNTAAMNSAATGNFIVRQINNNLRVRNLVVERGASSGAGPAVDIANTGNRQYFENIFITQACTEYPMYMADGGTNTDIRNVTIQYDGGSPSARSGIWFSAVNTNGDGLTIDNVRLKSGSTRLNAVVEIQIRNPRTAAGVRVTNLYGDNQAFYGVYYGVTGTGFDATPVFQNINVGSGNTAYRYVNSSDADITTVYPIISGNRFDICTFTGTATPEGVVTAIQGCECILKSGDTTKKYWKSTGTGNTGWVQVTIP